MATGSAEAGERRIRTLSQQIADDLGAAIARGAYAPGERLGEIAIAAHYGVSRGPVREAIRALARRGLAVFYARRGAFVVGLSLDTLIDVFNTRAVLLGLAARYFAAVGSAEAQAALEIAARRLEALVDDPSCDPIAFAVATGELGALIRRSCGSAALSRLIAHQIDGSAWGTLWRQEPLDFTTQARRSEAASDYADLAAAILGRDAERADILTRDIVLKARACAIATLSRLRAETYDQRRLLTG